MEEFTYKKAGVDIDEAERFVEIISPIVKKTFRPEVMTDIGSFGALFRLDIKKYKNPVLVSGTDGVGTKLKIAFMMDRHDTVGIDLVAMCVNDILTLGAEPLFFLDYFATGRLKSEKAAEVIKGIAKGCSEAGCALIGGETAEMPDFYIDEEYDLAGFALGIVEKEEIVDGSKIKEGDSIIGLESNGLHSNGYSLARKVLFDFAGFNVDTYLPELKCTIGEELLRPTKIYVKAVETLKGKISISGMAHITGGGIVGNLPRILSGKQMAIIYEDSWDCPDIFNIIKKIGNVPDNEMRRTFNLGIGYIIVVPKEDSELGIKILRENGYNAIRIGHIERGEKGVNFIKG
jgi:phosphoribosylformylglycinamidine cyclo-ligase